MQKEQPAERVSAERAWHGHENLLEASGLSALHSHKVSFPGGEQGEPCGGDLEVEPQTLGERQGGSGAGGGGDRCLCVSLSRAHGMWHSLPPPHSGQSRGAQRRVGLSTLESAQAWEGGGGSGSGPFGFPGSQKETMCVSTQEVPILVTSQAAVPCSGCP